jgi:hypothetical protein
MTVLDRAQILASFKARVFLSFIVKQESTGMQISSKLIVNAEQKRVGLGN